MLYRVTKQYGRGPDILVEQFRDIQPAKNFIMTKLADDARVKVKSTWKLWEGMDLLEEFTELNLSDTSSRDEGSGSSSGQGQRSSFQPTPFNMAPRPPGSPHSWINDEEDDDKK